MNQKSVLILGDGHLAIRTKMFIAEKGFSVIHFPFLNKKAPNSSTLIDAMEQTFVGLQMNEFSMAYVLFDEDEENLEAIIALMSLYPEISMTTSLFNENIIPHLEQANAKLTILNPAKLASPFFVKSLDSNTHSNYKATIPAPVIESIQSKPSLLLFLVSFFLLIVGGAIVYFHFKENLSWIDAVYFVVVTIASVGYGDINLLNASTLSKIVGITLILCSTIFIWLIFSLLIDRIVKRREQILLGRKKYHYKNHIILCGLGRLGYFIAEELLKAGEKVVVIESDGESPNVAHFKNSNIDVYVGDAKQPHVLQNAGAAHCRALIAATNNDYANLEIGLNARYFKSDVLLVLRIFDETTANTIKEKFDIHITKSVSYIAAKKFASLLEAQAIDP